MQLYAKVGTYLFPPAALLTSIPVFSIIVRYNLMENQICGSFVANLFSVVLPWVVALFFFSGARSRGVVNTAHCAESVRCIARCCWR